MFSRWIKLSFDTAMLGIETQRVVGLRMVRIGAGGPPRRLKRFGCFQRRGGALAEAAMTIASGGSPEKIIRRYRTHVRSNKNWLLKIG